MAAEEGGAPSSPEANARKWQLFAIDKTHQAIALFANTELQPGAFAAPDATVFLDLPSGAMAYDSRRDILYVGRSTATPLVDSFQRITGSEIFVYTNASTMGADARPSSIFSP